MIQYRRLITFRPEGGGPCEAVSVPIPEERRMLQVRRDTLDGAMVPARGVALEEMKIGAAVSRMLRGYTVLRNSDTTGLVKDLVSSLNSFPAWATEKVCNKVHDGEYAHIKREYPPTVPQLCDLIRTELAFVKAEQHQIDDTLALVARDAELTPEQQAQRQEQALAWLKREDPRAAALIGSLPGKREDDTARIEAMNRRVFERECHAAGIDPANGVSPSLLKLLHAPMEPFHAEH